MALGTAHFGGERASWAVWFDQAQAVFRHALTRGITFFDSGSTYGGGDAERYLGTMIRDNARRQDVVVTTKVFFPTGEGANARGLSRHHIRQAVDESLKRLGTDYIDVLMIHRWDATTPIEETLSALDDVVRSGRALYLGASSMSAWRFMKALGLQRSNGLAPFVCMQNLHNLLYREEEREMNPLCDEEGIGRVPWSPLARGLLCGPGIDPLREKDDRLLRDRSDAELDGPVLDALDQIVTATGSPHAAIALAWLYTKGIVAPAVGPSSPAQLDTALQALELVLSAEHVSQLEASYRPHIIMGHQSNG